MATARPFEVTLNVSGSVKVQDKMRFDTLKELNMGEVFRSGIEIQPSEEVFDIVVIIITSQQEKANKIALLFVGRMLDILSIKLNVPLFVSLHSDWKYVRKTNQKAILQKSDFQSSFEFSRLSNDNYSTFLRGLSWYRKALYTEDPYDKFFAFWLSIEVIANKFNPNKENCKDPKTGRYKGSICNIWECFKHLWGECNQWDIITGQDKWINENAEIRNKIGHGTFSVDVRSVDDVLQKLDLLRQVSYKFLLDWARKEFHRQLDENEY
jgi:hypothetical protein